MLNRILIIEDHPDNQKLMAYLLEQCGYEVQLADTGEEGIELAHRESFDLILCDIRLPVMDGFEVARRLKSDAKCNPPPLVAISALTSLAERDEILRAGFDGFVPKATAPRLFMQQVRSFLPDSNVARNLLAIPMGAVQDA